MQCERDCHERIVPSTGQSTQRHWTADGVQLQLAGLRTKCLHPYQLFDGRRRLQFVEDLLGRAGWLVGWLLACLLGWLVWICVAAYLYWHFWHWRLAFGMCIPLFCAFSFGIRHQHWNWHVDCMRVQLTMALAEAYLHTRVPSPKAKCTDASLEHQTSTRITCNSHHHHNHHHQHHHHHSCCPSFLSFVSRTYTYDSVR